VDGKAQAGVEGEVASSGFESRSAAREPYQVEKRMTQADIAAEEARIFFLDRLQKQAIADHAPLSELEIQYMDYSRIQTNEECDRIEAGFLAKYDSDAFDDRIKVLIQKAIKKDTVTDPKALDRYRQHLSALKDSPHGQLSSLVSPALTSSMPEVFSVARGRFWAALGIILLVSLLLVLWDTFAQR
jgi:hypothetical protein